MLPGNHDVPLYNVFTRFLTPLARYKRAITSDLSPVYRDDEMIVVGVNTARSSTGEKAASTKPGRRHRRRRCRACPRDVMRVVVTHHPFDLPEGVREERLVGRAAMAMKKLTAGRAPICSSPGTCTSVTSATPPRATRSRGHSALVVQAGTVSTRSRGEQPSFNVSESRARYLGGTAGLGSGTRGVQR